MAYVSGSTVFSRLYGNSTKELNSERFYDAMDSDLSNLDTNYKICEEKLISKKKSEIIPICKKYLRFLENSKPWGDTNNEYDVSLLLNYWLYDKIAEFYGFKNIDEISVDFSALQIIWDHFDESRKHEQYYHKFKPDINIFKEDEWEKRRKLYEYYVNYYEIYGNSLINPSKCEEYYENFKEMISVYKHFEEKCSPVEYNCPKFFGKFKSQNPVYNIEKLSCYQKIDQQRTASIEARPYGPGDSLQSAVPRPGLSQHGVDGDLQDSAGSTRDTQSTSQSSDIKTKVTNSVLGAAPVLLTATMLYRYTPLGPWIRRFGGGGTNSMSAMGGVSPYMQETGEMFSDNEANYISYQPM